MMLFVWLFILLCLVSVNQFFLLHQNGKNKTFYTSSVWVPGMQTCVSQTMQLMHGSPLNPHHHHQLTPSPRPPPLFLSQAMMRGSCKQLISSLFAHMCLTPHGPQWVLGLCSDTISSANIGHWKKGGKKPKTIPLLDGLFGSLWLVLLSAEMVMQSALQIKDQPLETEDINLNTEEGSRQS